MAAPDPRQQAAYLAQAPGVLEDRQRAALPDLHAALAKLLHPGPLERVQDVEDALLGLVAGDALTVDQRQCLIGPLFSTLGAAMAGSAARGPSLLAWPQQEVG